MQKEIELARAEIYRGRQHKLVFLALEERTLMVSEIMRKVNEQIKKPEDGKTLTLREVSRSLKWLAGRGYAECLNPSSEHGVKGIIYSLSRKGSKIRRL
jgi:hypothetical protein